MGSCPSRVFVMGYDIRGAARGSDCRSHRITISRTRFPGFPFGSAALGYVSDVEMWALSVDSVGRKKSATRAPVEDYAQNPCFRVGSSPSCRPRVSRDCARASLRRPDASPEPDSLRRAAHAPAESPGLPERARLGTPEGWRRGGVPSKRDLRLARALDAPRRSRENPDASSGGRERSELEEASRRGKLRLTYSDRTGILTMSSIRTVSSV
jgi:hypothetical protein